MPTRPDNIMLVGYVYLTSPVKISCNSLYKSFIIIKISLSRYLNQLYTIRRYLCFCRRTDILLKGLRNFVNICIVQLTLSYYLYEPMHHICTLYNVHAA